MVASVATKPFWFNQDWGSVRTAIAWTRTDHPLCRSRLAAAEPAQCGRDRQLQEVVNELEVEQPQQCQARARQLGMGRDLRSEWH